MEFRPRETVLTIAAGFLLGLYGAVNACDEAAIQACANAYIADCRFDDYETCLMPTGLQGCTSLTDETTKALIAPAAVCLRLGNIIKANVPGGSIPGVTEGCTTEFHQCFGSISDRAEQRPITNIPCLCEDPAAYIQEVFGDFSTCLQATSCPGTVTSVMKPDQFLNGSIGALTSMCSGLSISEGACKCSKKIEACMVDNLSEDYLQQEQAVNQVFYPRCLVPGNRTYTDAQFERVAACLLDLDGDCRLKVETWTQDTFQSGSQGNHINYAYTLLGLALSCRKGCEGFMQPNDEYTAQRRNAAAAPCFRDRLEEFSLTNGEVNALRGQAKTDFCNTVDDVLSCFVERLEDCPTLTLLLQLQIRGQESGLDLPVEGMGIPANFTFPGDLFDVCGVNLLEYSSTFSGGNSLDSSHKLSLMVLLAVTLAALLHLV